MLHCIRRALLGSPGRWGERYPNSLHQSGFLVTNVFAFKQPSKFSSKKYANPRNHLKIIQSVNRKKLIGPIAVVLSCGSFHSVPLSLSLRSGISKKNDFIAAYRMINRNRAMNREGNNGGAWTRRISCSDIGTTAVAIVTKMTSSRWPNAKKNNPTSKLNISICIICINIKKFEYRMVWGWIRKYWVSRGLEISYIPGKGISSRIKLQWNKINWANWMISQRNQAFSSRG